MKKKSEVSLIDLLHDAGFETTVEVSPRIIHASSADDFGKSHAAFLQSAGKNPALLGCFRFECVPAPLLIVHRNLDVANQEPEAVTVGDTPAEEAAQ